MKPKNNPLLCHASLASIALTLGTAGSLFLDSAQAGSATWTNGAGTNVLNTAGNWSAGGPPNASGDTATWNGTVSGNLALTYNGIFGVATLGTTIDITSSQAGSISIGSTNAATNTTFALQNLTVANGAFSGVASGPGFFFGGGSGFDQMTFRNNSGTAPFTNTLTNNSNKTATFGTDVTFSSGNASARTLVFAGTGNWDVNSNLSVGNFSVTKQDAGTLTLAATNTYGGLTTVTGGALNVGSSGSLKSGNALTVGASGTADFANAGQTLGAVDNANTATNALNFSSATGTVTLASLTGAGNTRFGSAGTVTGGISTGTVTSVGAMNANISGGTVTAGGLLTGTISNGTVGAGSLSSTAVSGGTNTITSAAGITTLSGGSTTVGGVATIGTMSSGTANLNGATSAITTLNGGSVNLGSSTVLTVSGGTTSGSITGSGGSLIKDAAGTLTLSSGGTYSYGGTTSVTDGKLIVNGNISTSSLTTVSGTGTLGGSGTLGAVSVLTGGTFAPGNSIDSLGITGALTLESGSFSVFEINTTGNISDLAIISGLLTFGGTLNVNNVGGALVNGDTFDLFNWGSKSGTFSAVNLPGLDPGLTWDQSQFYTNGTLTVVPEPRAPLLGGLGLLALLRRKR